jgi:hypothetical protein
MRLVESAHHRENNARRIKGMKTETEQVNAIQINASLSSATVEIWRAEAIFQHSRYCHKTPSKSVINVGLKNVP